MNEHRHENHSNVNINQLIDFSKVLRAIFFTSILALILIAVNVLQNPIDLSAISIMILLVLVLFLFWLFNLGYEKISGTGLILAVSTIVTYNFVIAGGINDNGMVIFPVLIIISGLILGRGFVPYFTALIISEVTIIYILTRTGFIKPYDGAITTYFHVYAIVLILLIITGIIIYITILTIERNILKMKESEKILKTALNQTVDGWGKALELFDRDTEGHSLRVTEIALQLARELSLPQEDLENIRRGSLLHDIGKMGIAEELLNKKGLLTDDERTEIDRHPLYSYVLLKDVQFLQSAMDIPVYHHEQWDGNGYPYQLSGQDIPLAARIFAIADNWDALSSDRPYRKAWPIEKVIEYIREEKGKKFDPQLVELFLAMISR